MAGVNKVIIIGNLGQNPEIRIMPNGESAANLSVATSETWVDKQTGEKRENTEWNRIIFFRRQAEICRDYLHKGAKIYIEGRLKTRKWADEQGIDRYVTEIQGSSLQMLDTRQEKPNNKAQANGQNDYQKAKEGKYTPPSQDNFDDDISF